MSCKFKLRLGSGLVTIFGLLFLTLPALAHGNYLRPAVGEINSTSPGAERASVTTDGLLAVFNSSGKLLSNFPVSLDDGSVFVSSPVLVDLDGDKIKEIAVEGQTSGDLYSLYVYKVDGSLFVSSTLPADISEYDPVAIRVPTQNQEDLLFSTASDKVLEYYLNSNHLQSKEILNNNHSLGITANKSGTIIYTVSPSVNQLNIYKKISGVWSKINTFELPKQIIYPLADDQNGKLYGIQNDGKLVAVNSQNGTVVSGFPVALPGVPVASPVVGDIDPNNAGLEIEVILSNGKRLLVSESGTILDSKIKSKSFLDTSADNLEASGLFSGHDSVSGIVSGVNKNIIASPVSNINLPFIEATSTDSLPASVSGLSLDYDVNAIILTWNNYTSTTAKFNHFNIYRTTSTSSTIDMLSPIAQISNASNTVYLDNSVLLNTNYYYLITAVDNAGLESEAGNWVGPATAAPSHSLFVSFLVDKLNVVADGSDIQTATLTIKYAKNVDQVDIMTNLYSTKANPQRGHFQWTANACKILWGQGGDLVSDLVCAKKAGKNFGETDFTFRWKLLPKYGAMTSNTLAYYWKESALNYTQTWIPVPSALFNSIDYVEPYSSFASLTISKPVVQLNADNQQSATLNIYNADSVDQVDIMTNFSNTQANPQRGHFVWTPTSCQILGGQGGEFVSGLTCSKQAGTVSGTTAFTFTWKLNKNYGILTGNNVSYYWRESTNNYTQFWATAAGRTFDTISTAPPLSSFVDMEVEKATVMANNSDTQTAVLSIKDADSVDQVDIMTNFSNTQANPQRGHFKWTPDSCEILWGQGGEYVAGLTCVRQASSTPGVTEFVFTWKFKPSFGAISGNNLSYYWRETANEYTQFWQTAAGSDFNVEVPAGVLNPSSFDSLTIDKQVVQADGIDTQTVVLNIKNAILVDQVDILTNLYGTQTNPQRGHFQWTTSTCKILWGQGGEFVDNLSCDKGSENAQGITPFTFTWKLKPTYGEMTSNTMAYYWRETVNDYTQYWSAVLDKGFSVITAAPPLASFVSMNLAKPVVVADGVDAQSATFVINNADAIDRFDIMTNFSNTQANPQRGHFKWTPDSCEILGGQGAEYVSDLICAKTADGATNTTNFTFSWKLLPAYGSMTDNIISYYWIESSRDHTQYWSDALGQKFSVENAQ